MEVDENLIFLRHHKWYKCLHPTISLRNSLMDLSLNTWYNSNLCYVAHLVQMFANFVQLFSFSLITFSNISLIPKLTMLTWRLHYEPLNSVQLKTCSDQAKANAKAKIFFDVCRLFFDLFRLFFDLFRFRVRFRSLWAGLNALWNFFYVL